MGFLLAGVRQAIQDEYQATLEAVRHGGTGNLRAIRWLDGIARALAAIEEVERKSGLGESGERG